MLGFGHTIPKLRQNYKEPPTPSFFDQFGTPAAAYSLRDLSGSNPNVIEVRRSLDNAVQDFTASEITDGSLTTWVGAGNDGFIRTWYDQAGANDATQTTAANQPKIVNSGAVVLENSLPAVDFDGVNDVIPTSNLFNSVTSYSGFFVSKKNATNTFGCLISGFDSFASFNYIFQFNDDGRISSALSGLLYNVTYQTNTGNYSTSLELNINLFNGALSNPNENKLFKNSVAQTFTPNNANEVNQLKIGITQTTIGARLNAQHFSGKVSEIIIYDADKSADRTAIETNINDYYSIY